MQARILAPLCPDPRVCPRKRAHRLAGAEQRLPRLVRLGRELLEKRRRSPRALDPRYRAASSRASTSPEFMLCTPTGAAWCAASPASQMPPLPKLRVRRHSNDATVDQ